MFFISAFRKVFFCKSGFSSSIWPGDDDTNWSFWVRVRHDFFWYGKLLFRFRPLHQFGQDDLWHTDFMVLDNLRHKIDKKR